MAWLLAPGFAFSAAATDLAGLSGDSLSGSTTAPSYTAAGLVQGAAEITEPLAPNALATLYGANLSFVTHVLGPADLTGSSLPLSLGGVTVFVGYLPVPLLYVSPGQINFVMPYNIIGTSTVLYVERQNVTGPVISVPLATTAPSFFAGTGNIALATHTDGSMVTSAAPASPGEVIVLYAAGLGRTQPDVLSGEIVPFAATLYYVAELQVFINGVPCSSGSILYAGLTPGYPGLYQINLRMPANLPANPTVQMSMGAQTSPVLQLPAL